MGEIIVNWWRAATTTVTGTAANINAAPVAKTGAAAVGGAIVGAVFGIIYATPAGETDPATAMATKVGGVLTADMAAEGYYLDGNGELRDPDGVKVPISVTAASKTRESAKANAFFLLPSGKARDIFGWGSGSKEAEIAANSVTKEKVLAMKEQTTREAVRAWGEVYWHAKGVGRGEGVAVHRLSLMQKILDYWDQ